MLLEAALTHSPASGTKRAVGRVKINDEQYPAKFPEGTLARISAVLEGKEKRSDFIRAAVERELKRRERVRTNPPTLPSPAKSPDEE
jgi:hypothetical protein